MNYYEQFYDDLEFCDPEDDPYHHIDPYYHDDPYYRRDPYYRDDPHYHRDNDGERYREQGHFHQDRRVPNIRGGGRGHPSERGHLSDRGHPNERIYPIDRGQMSERGHGRGHGPPRGYDNSSRGQRNEGNAGERGMNRGRGNIPRGNHRGGIKTMAFVKAGANNTASSSDQNNTEEEGNRTGANKSDQIRFDYKSYQNQPSKNEVEEEQALKAYTCHLGFGYGYGPRSDLIEGDQPEWLIGPEAECQTEGQVASEVLPDSPTETKAIEKPEAKSNVKKAMVSPAFNFVKAKSEFHSIDVAFHETEKEEKPTPNSLSVNFGNKRVGLGFGVSVNKSSGPGVNKSASYHPGVKDGCSPQINARFTRLQEAVKVRSLPNKNAIEILHMAVDKVKMVISDEISTSGRTPAGQAMFLCKLEIDGVLVAQGQATAKKAAKHQAYQNALEVFANPAVAVKEVSSGLFELRRKSLEFKAPNAVGPSAAKATGQNAQYGPGHKRQTGTTSVGPAAKSLSQSATGVAGRNTAVTTSQASLSSYNKPKIVFHQPSHPLNNKPLEFNSNDSSQSQMGTQNRFSLTSKPEDLAMKLLNFVKESSMSESESGTGSSSDSSSRIASTMQNPRKRSKSQLQNLDTGKLKVQKRGGNVNHSIEDLSQFILIDSTPLNQTVNELSVLHNSANFNRVVLKLEYENVPKGTRCSLVLSDIIVAISQAETKEDARREVACDSLEYLRECCYTIRIKQAVDSDASGLTKEQLLSDIQKAGEAGGGGVIPDTNIGNMLLRKMGWVGGGCGKDGTGIAEPVKAEMVIGREGLGLKAEKGIGRNFHQRVTKMFQDYIRSDEQKDLHFSSELSKDERAIIHNIGQKLGLKTHSKGKAENRYLIVSRKRSAQQLLEHVRESGGSTSKYELIPPGDSDLDVMRREDISHGHCKQ